MIAVKICGDYPLIVVRPYMSTPETIAVPFDQDGDYAVPFDGDGDGDNPVDDQHLRVLLWLEGIDGPIGWPRRNRRISSQGSWFVWP